MIFRHEKVLWLTRTAIFLALLIVAQWATVPLGNSILTGAIVNMMLILSVMLNGLASGLTIAAISPVMPTLLGFGPVWPLVPFIAAGNIVLVVVWHFAGNREMRIKRLAHILALVIAALAKFLVIYFGVVRLAVPFLLDLKPKQVEVISLMFSYPQLITATIGGAVATVLLPTLKKAVNKGAGSQ